MVKYAKLRFQVVENETLNVVKWLRSQRLPILGFMIKFQKAFIAGE